MPAKKIPGDRLIPIYPVTEPIRIKYKDIFDFKEFYDALHLYLPDKGWGDESGGDKFETYYGERIGSNGGKELWIWWRMMKNAEDTPFIKYYLDFDYHCLNLIGTEIVKEGKKIKVHKGEVELKIWAYVELGFLEKFENNPILKHFKNLFVNRIYAKNIEQRKKELYQEVYALQNFIKQWLKLKRYLPYEETKNFFPSYAWPSHLKD